MLTPRTANREESESGRIRNKFNSQTSVPATLSVLFWDSDTIMGSLALKFFFIGLSVGTRDAIGSKLGF